MEKETHSGIGIASFIISLITATNMLSAIIMSGVVAMNVIGNAAENLYMVVGLFMFFYGFLCIVGIGLGIAGLLQKNRSKLFSVLGLVTNIGVIFLVVSLMILGSSVS